MGEWDAGGGSDGDGDGDGDEWCDVVSGVWVYTDTEDCLVNLPCSIELIGLRWRTGSTELDPG